LAKSPALAGFGTLVGRQRLYATAMPDRPDGELFLVRLWHERSERRGINLRGYVEHVTSKQSMYFSDLADLNDFLRFRHGDSDRLAHEGNERRARSDRGALD